MARHVRRSETCSTVTTCRTAAPGSAVSRGDFLQDREIHRLVGDDPFEAQILLFEGLQPFGLINPQPAVLLFHRSYVCSVIPSFRQPSSTGRPLPVSSSTVRRC